jgi:neutral amino acid transport system ATP-binding protein
MGALLEVAELCKRFGGVTAVDDCSFAVADGSVTALIGPNGSGKTTAFNLITGYLPTDRGVVTFAGRNVTGMDPGRLYRRGLSRTFQQARVFLDLTVRENLVVAAGAGWPDLFRRRLSHTDRSHAADLLEEFRLSAVADLLAAELSWGQRKLLEFAAVLMSDPRLVLLDEPTAGVNPVLCETMETHIRTRNATGVTFLIVEHDMRFVMQVCDPVIVLDAGRTIATGSPEQVQTDPRVLDAYLGA